MEHSDAFALQNSGLNAFLFAEVGNEVNGSPLTILSLLARLGADPWAEAARLARLPKAAIIDYLMNGISMMPLCPQALADARSTATRVILLLPSQTPPAAKALPVGKFSIPRWVPMAVFIAVLAMGIAFQLMPAATPTTLVEPAATHPPAPGD
jgi:hypothetical protein